MSSMKPQDVMVACKLLTIGEERWSFGRLSKSLGLSMGAAHNAVAHLLAAGLVVEKEGKAIPSRKKLLDFLLFGVPSVFYPVKGGLLRGMPTAASAPPLLALCQPREVPVVWPVANGRVTGETLVPIYETVPRAAAADPHLYEYLVLLDGLRVGKAKERKIAAEVLEQKIMAAELGAGKTVRKPEVAPLEDAE